MKILYFGTFCDYDKYKEILDNSRVKPSAAPFVFEGELISGFAKNKADVEVFSFPSIAAFPKSSTLFIKSHNTVLNQGYNSTWIPAINISGIKQFCQRFFSRKMLNKWLKDNSAEEKAVLIYSIYQPIAKSIVSICKKQNIPCFAIVPDLPGDMYSNSKISPIKKFFTGFYLRAAEKIQSGFDGYIYLTEYMKDIINNDAPYTVVEGISGDFDFDSAEKEDSFIIMYAGALSEKMGVKTLLKSFSRLKSDNVRLWLFGGGDCETDIKIASDKDSRIDFFGFMDRAEILRRESRASLLVNLRDPSEEYTKYSFPSKTLEYMMSGTPLLTTKLRGIPSEYFNYCFTLEDGSVDSVTKKLKEIISLPAEELSTLGQRAKEFVKENKNALTQSKKILGFISDTVKERFQ
ncbi:MAG: glycosyltransferase [Monoglobales bacterium]